MTSTICFIAWLYAMFSDKNQSTGLTCLCWMAWAFSVGDI